MEKRLQIFILASSLYFINDLLFIPIHSWPAWLAVDYLTRILSLGVIGYALYRGGLGLPRLYLKRLPPLPLLMLAAVVAIPGTLAIHGIDEAFKGVAGWTRLAVFPDITLKWAEYVDLTFGLMLVAVSEELIFRSLFYDLFHERLSRRGLVILSSIFFALVHWGMGIDTVLGAFVWGVMAMGLFIRIRSVYPLVLGHYMVNLVLFSGVLD